MAFRHLRAAFWITLALLTASCGKTPVDDPQGPDIPVDTRPDWSGLSFMIGKMDELLALEEDQPWSGYPDEAFAALKDARKAAADAREKAREGKIGQDKIDDAVSAARSAIDAFQAQYKFVEAPCEMHVPGATSIQCGILLGKPGDFDDITTFTAELWFKGEQVLHYQQQAKIIGNFKGVRPFDGWGLNSWATTQEPDDTHPRKGPYVIRMSLCYRGGSLREPCVDWKDYTGWHHLAASFDAAKGHTVIYLDGEIILEDTYVAEYAKPAEPTQLTLLCNPGSISSGYHSMSMDASAKKVRFWRKELSQSEIRKYKDCEVTGQEDGLEAAWDFTTAPADPGSILDKTGRYYADAQGPIEWRIIK